MHTLPPPGFGIQAAPAPVIAYGNGGDEGAAVAPRVARPARAPEAMAAAAPRAARTAEQPSSPRRFGHTASRSQSQPSSGGVTSASASQPDASAKRPPGARPTAGLVPFARTSSSGGETPVASDARSSRAEAKAKSSRGLAPRPRRASESPRALAALGAVGSVEHGRAEQREVLRDDADATMQLAQSERSEHLHSADELEALGAQ